MTWTPVPVFCSSLFIYLICILFCATAVVSHSISWTACFCFVFNVRNSLEGFILKDLSVLLCQHYIYFRNSVGMSRNCLDIWRAINQSNALTKSSEECGICVNGRFLSYHNNPTCCIPTRLHTYPSPYLAVSIPTCF